MGESTGTAQLCISKMTRGIYNNETIMGKYLRAMDKSDAVCIERMHFKKHGIYGMLGSLDVMRIPWENCPYEQQGQHVGKGGIPPLGLDAVADNAL